MKKLIVLFLLVILTSCGSDEATPGFTRVLLNKNSDKAILDGGIFIGAANIEGIVGSYSVILDDENETAILEIPNGSYRFGGIGYAKNATSGNRISDDLRCGGASNGDIFNLNGQTLELTLVFDKATCTSDYFAPLNERDPGDATEIPLVRFASCSGALPTSAGAGCAPGTSLGGVVSFLAGSAGVTEETLTSNIIAIGAGTVVTPGANLTMRIPGGNDIVFPVLITTLNKKYFFPFGFNNGTKAVDDAVGEGVAFYNSTTDILEVYIKD